MSCKIERFNWITVKVQLSSKYWVLETWLHFYQYSIIYILYIYIYIYIYIYLSIYLSIYLYIYIYKRQNREKYFKFPVSFRFLGKPITQSHDHMNLVDLDKRASGTGKPGIYEYFTLLQSFYRGTLSIKWYMDQNF